MNDDKELFEADKDNPKLKGSDKFEKTIDKVISSASIQSPLHKALSVQLAHKSASNSIQETFEFCFNVAIEKTINGVGMGVLDNGVPYLSENGLAQMCDIARSTIYDIANNWKVAKEKNSRAKEINKILIKNNYKEEQLFIPIKIGNQKYNAYPEDVCLAFLEYFAFYSKPLREKARENLLLLARKTFRDFIYTAVEYQPQTKNATSWKHFHDRVSLTRDKIPQGYFCIFKEVAGLILDLINANLPINDKTIPDGSVGLHWGNYWRSNNLENKYGNRVKYDHYYPDEFRQSASNPQEANAYPLDALGEFRKWFESEYLTNKYPSYIEKKIKALEIEHSHGEGLKRLFLK
jgi:hypothetical protein